MATAFIVLGIACAWLSIDTLTLIASPLRVVGCASDPDWDAGGLRVIERKDFMRHVSRDESYVPIVTR